MTMQTYYDSVDEIGPDLHRSDVSIIATWAGFVKVRRFQSETWFEFIYDRQLHRRLYKKAYHTSWLSRLAWQFVRDVAWQVEQDTKAESDQDNSQIQVVYLDPNDPLSKLFEV